VTNDAVRYILVAFIDQRRAVNACPKSSIPAPDHSWRRSPIGKAKFLRPSQFSKN
jgi:hypothetical protein